LQVTEMAKFRNKFMMMEETCRDCNSNQLWYKMMGVKIPSRCASCGSENMRRVQEHKGLTLNEAKYLMRLYYEQSR
jgi:predicted Zn-ribbon and HTH transcriptional regulator